MSSDNPLVYLKVNVALGDVLTIRFPRGVEFVSKGVELGNASVFAVEAMDRKISVRPKVPDGMNVGARELLGERSNLQIETRRGWQINLDLRQWYPSQSARTIIFTSREVEKEEAYVERRIAEAEQRIRENLSERESRLNEEAAMRATQAMARAVLTRNACSDRTKTAMKDLLWIRQERICAVGTDVYVVFRIRNRARGDEFRLGDIELVGNDAPLDAIFVLQRETGELVRFEDVALRMNDEVLGSIVVPGEGLPAEMKLRVTESGGKQRVVVVDNVQF